MNKISIVGLSILGGLLIGCRSSSDQSKDAAKDAVSVIVQAEDFNGSSVVGQTKEGETAEIGADQWLSYDLNVPVLGRYKVEVVGSGGDSAMVWIEDYVDNKDERTYDITGKMLFQSSADTETVTKDGSPLNAGLHKVKIHASKAPVKVDYVKFTLMKEHTATPTSFEQKMDGKEWSLVWSDEFEGSGLPDTTKWDYNIGNWGWGNNEPQYYTALRTENARLENGTLIIEARKNDMGQPWTSARLTTQGKESFLYGKIEFRAKIPVGRGTWSAGWLLGDEYKDEMSWPYCGEIDVLESVGYETDDKTGNGINHATCHTRAYYFKQNNQIGSEIKVDNMNGEFHTYGIEWYPDRIEGYLDGKKYYTYDKNKNELEWPFFKPQSIILNLAVGGGWGGAKGLDPNWDSHQFILDYVRVYEKK